MYILRGIEKLTNFFFILAKKVFERRSPKNYEEKIFKGGLLERVLSNYLEKTLPS